MVALFEWMSTCLKRKRAVSQRVLGPLEGRIERFGSAEGRLQGHAWGADNECFGKSTGTLSQLSRWNELLQ
jgi:hypothetical protein